jgi:hypothetical protein
MQIHSSTKADCPSGRSTCIQRFPFILLAVCCLLQISACVLRPDWQKLSSEGQLESRWLDTGRFRHLVLSNQQRGSHLRIYVEGDGEPWIRKSRVALDPTPSNPVLLRLMHDATHPAVYLGRPCYFGTATDQECEQRWWTFDRYGQVVVDSMCLAANQLARQFGAQTVELIGYSGGGAVVVGMRDCTDRLKSISTIAGNLDPVAWAAHHGYTPLGDLSPLTVAAIERDEPRETHWQCRDDLQVPPFVTDNYFAVSTHAIRHIVRSCSHAEGWQQYWSQIIDSSTVN